MDEEQRSLEGSFVGVGYAVGAFALWGILPLYWKVLAQVPAAQILAHRILWSFIFVAVLLTVWGRWSVLKETVMRRENRRAVILGSLFISGNWFLYIWAVNSGHVVEASMGYYINPLFSVALGVAVLRERLNFWQWISMGLAFTGVLYATVQLGKFPWVALTLAVTFALYGLVKKKADLEALVGLGLETAVVLPFALGYLVFCHQKHMGAFGEIWWVTLLLMGAGVVTATPLLWFAEAAKRVPLSTVGIAQYISPSLTLLFGVLVFGESFTPAHSVSFGLIWAALILFSCAKTPWLIRMQPKCFKRDLRPVS